MSTVQEPVTQTGVNVTKIRYHHPQRGEVCLTGHHLSGLVPVANRFIVVVVSEAAAVNARATNMSSGQEAEPVQINKVDDTTWELGFDLPPGCTLVAIRSVPASEPDMGQVPADNTSGASDCPTFALQLAVGLSVWHIKRRRIHTEADIGTPHAGDTVGTSFPTSGGYVSASSTLVAKMTPLPVGSGNEIDVPATKYANWTWSAQFNNVPPGRYQLCIVDSSGTEQNQCICPITVQ
jgi:hypothetical protein